MLEREIKLVKENKKAAIVCMGTRISLNSKNVRSVDLIYLRNILQDVYGRTVDYLTLKTKKEVDLDYFKNVADENINDYDAVNTYLSTKHRYQTPVENNFDYIDKYVIFTTLDCNARCFYCYELKSKGKTPMSIETAEKVAKYIITHCPKGTEVSLDWFGGEPLFN